MSKITFECPDDILQTLSETPERFAEKGRLLIAVKLFELGRLSSGQAARFADMDRVRVFRRLEVLPSIGHQSVPGRIGKGFLPCQRSVASIHPHYSTFTE